MSDAVRAAHVRPFIAVDLLFDAPNQLFLWSGPSDLGLNGNTYLGAGNLLSISEIEETADIRASGLTCILSGVSTTIKSLVLTEKYSGRSLNVYKGLLNTDGTRTVLSSIKIFSGLMDQMSYEPEGTDKVTVRLTAEHELIRLERPNVRLLSDEEQRSRFPEDTGLSFKTVLPEREIVWKQ